MIYIHSHIPPGIDGGDPHIQEVVAISAIDCRASMEVIPSHPHGAIGKNSGFTIIELIAVLLIIGILSAMAISRAGSTDVFNLVSEVEILKGHLRYAQSRAMGDKVSWGIDFTGSSYTLLKDGKDSGSNFPNGSSSTHDLPDGFSITDTKVIFSPCWGIPGGSGDITVTLHGRQNSETITITRNTGFIP